MHELPFAKSILHTVLEVAEKENAQAVVKVVLEVGALRDFVPEFVNKYWMYVCRGSIAEGSEIEMITLPAIVRCAQCGKEYPIPIHDVTQTRCPACHCDRGALVSGRELRILNIQIKEDRPLARR